jgi:phosphatidylglycerophosphate synthase
VCVVLPLLAFGHPLVALLAGLMTFPLDAVDGTMARLGGTSGDGWGLYIDVMADRVVDTAVWGGLTLWAIYAHLGAFTVITAVLGGALATLQSVAGVAATAVEVRLALGPFQRTERLLLLGFATVTAGLGYASVQPVAYLIVGVASLAGIVHRSSQVRTSMLPKSAPLERSTNVAICAVDKVGPDKLS